MSFGKQMKEALKKAGTILGAAFMKIVRVPSNYRKVDNKVSNFLTNNCGPLGRPINFLRKFVIPVLLFGPIAGPVIYLAYRYVAKPIVQATFALLKPIVVGLAGLVKGAGIGIYQALKKSREVTQEQTKDIDQKEVIGKDKDDVELKKYRETKLVEKYDVAKMVDLTKAPEEMEKPTIKAALYRLDAAVSTILKKSNGIFTTEVAKDIFNGMDGNSNRVFDVSILDPTKGYLKDGKISCKIQFLDDNKYKVLRITPIVEPSILTTQPQEKIQIPVAVNVDQTKEAPDKSFSLNGLGCRKVQVASAPVVEPQKQKEHSQEKGMAL